MVGTQVAQETQVWNSPHNIRIAGSKFAIDTVSQGALQWQVRPTRREGHWRNTAKGTESYARPLLWRRDAGILPTCELMSKCIYGLSPLRSSRRIHVYMTLILYMLICLRDFESHCFQGYREHKHHIKCPLLGTWRWWQCGLRAELRLCESWAMVECLNQEKHCLFLQSRSSQSTSKDTDLTCWGRVSSSHREITGSCSLQLVMKSSMMLIGLCDWKVGLDGCSDQE